MFWIWGPIRRTASTADFSSGTERPHCDVCGEALATLQNRSKARHLAALVWGANLMANVPKMVALMPDVVNTNHVNTFR